MATRQNPVQQTEPTTETEASSEPKVADTYVVKHAAVNVWDGEFELKDAKKDRMVRRLNRGQEVTAEDLKHADIKRLLSLGAIAKKTKEEQAIDPLLGGFRVDGEDEPGDSPDE